MPYNPLTVTQPDETPSFAFPSITPELTLVMDESDGDIIGPIHANAAMVAQFSEKRQKMVTVASVEEVKIEVYVTEARVVLICKKYDKGGGWIGGPAAIAFNAGSKILAANRRRGKALTAQIRYPWIARVLFQPKRGFGGVEAIKFSFKSEGTSMTLQIQLDKSTDSGSMAYEIVKRLVAYRLADTDDKSPEELKAFHALLDAGQAEAPPKGKMGSYVIPTSYPAGGGAQYAPVGPPSTLK
jgi:hypothetical protein